MSRVDLKNTHAAGRALGDDELRAIWKAADQLGYPFGPFFKLLILTGQRRNEWADARWSEIDGERKWLEVGRKRYKGDRDHIVPLSNEAWAILDKLPKFPNNDCFIFSTTDGQKSISGFSRAKKRLDQAAQDILNEASHSQTIELKRYRIHDFRVTCETRFATLGFNQEVRDAVLGHAKPGLQKTYNKHDYVEEKRVALAAYTDHLIGELT
jgi:integrase